jgi:hypothetical protein
MTMNNTKPNFPVKPVFFPNERGRCIWVDHNGKRLEAKILSSCGRKQGQTAEIAKTGERVRLD